MTEALTSRNFAAGDAADFENLITRRLYIDKTSFLEDLVHRAAVLQILRPRGFGKTLSMSMLASFLEMNYLNPEDRSRPERLFKDLAVCKNKAFCDEYMGRFPVIMISLKSVQGKDFPEAMKAMMRVLGALHSKFAFLADSDKQFDGFRDSFKETIEICCSDSFDLKDSDNMSTAVSIAKTSLLFLSEMLHTQYDRRAFIIVDGYDDPLEAATQNGYYDKMLNVIAGMLETALKTNYHLENGFVTGKLHISFQSIYSGFNNYVETNITNNSYAEFMGFTKDETAALLKTLGMENRLQDVMEWYGGYNFAGNDMVCPGSVMEFISRVSDPKSDPAAFPLAGFRANTGAGDIIGDSMRQLYGPDLDMIENLMHGGSEIITPITFTSYPEINGNTGFDTFATLMLHTGYFTEVRDAEIGRTEKTADGNSAYDDSDIVNNTVIKIPNKEVLQIFLEKAKSIFSKENPEWTGRALEMLNALFSGDAEQVQYIITDMLMSFVSIRDATDDGYYHGFLTSVLGIAAGTAGQGKNRINTIKMESQEDSGNGFSDIILSKTFEGKAVILEFKKCKTGTPKAFRNMCQEALKQIEKKKYEYRYRASGYQEIIKYGIAFYGKGCLVIKKTDEPVSE